MFYVISGDYALHIKCVEESLHLFFAANHHQYLRYGVAYLRMMECLPDSVREEFMKGQHTIHLRAGLWNGIWSDMGIETTWMKKGHGPGLHIIIIMISLNNDITVPNKSSK